MKSKLQVACGQVARGLQSQAVDYLRRHGPQTAASIAAARGWRVSTCGAVIRTLERAGLAHWSREDGIISLTTRGEVRADAVAESEAKRRAGRMRRGRSA